MGRNNCGCLSQIEKLKIVGISINISINRVDKNMVTMLQWCFINTTKRNNLSLGYLSITKKTNFDFKDLAISVYSTYFILYTFILGLYRKCFTVKLFDA